MLHARELTHASPLTGQWVTPCCQRTPFELSRWDRMTNDLTKVTCGTWPPAPHCKCCECWCKNCVPPWEMELLAEEHPAA